MVVNLHPMRCLLQHQNRNRFNGDKKTLPLRLELRTSRLTALRSNQLSYGRWTIQTLSGIMISIVFLIRWHFMIIPGACFEGTDWGLRYYYYYLLPVTLNCCAGKG